MKNLRQLLHASMFILVFAAGCKKTESGNEHNGQLAVQEAPVWETTDPVKIAAIRAEIETRVLNKTEAALAIETYKGFKIEKTTATPADILAFVKQEIDQLLVSGIKNSTAVNMETVSSIYIIPSSNAGLYYDGNLRRIVITDYASYRNVKKAPGNVVIHEAVHYLHDKFVPGGFNNSTNRTNYNSARSRQIYPAGVYVLSNAVEYLAVSSEAFFTGTNREPFNATRVQQKDPNEVSFIKATF